MQLRRNIAGDINRQRAKQAPTVKPKNKLNKVLHRFLDILLLVAALLLLGYSLLLTGRPKVSISSSIYHPSNVYQAAVGHDSNFFHKTKLTYNGQAIVSKLQKQFPEIASTKFSLSPFSTSPTLKLNISSPSFIVKSSSEKYLVDEQGVAVIPTTNANSSLLRGFYMVNDESGLILRPGVRVLNSNDVNFIEEVIVQTKAARVPISSLTLPPLSRELDMRTSDEPYFIKFYMGGSPILQSGQFLAARHSFEQKNVHPSTYLDVRVAGKIFFK